MEAACVCVCALSTVCTTLTCYASSVLNRVAFCRNSKNIDFYFVESTAAGGEHEILAKILYLYACTRAGAAAFIVMRLIVCAYIIARETSE